MRWLVAGSSKYIDSVKYYVNNIFFIFMTLQNKLLSQANRKFKRNLQQEQLNLVETRDSFY